MSRKAIPKRSIYEKCLEGIEKYNPSSLNELLKQLKPFFSRQTFYNKIKTDSKEYSDIVEKLEHQKVKFAYALKKKFYDMNNFKSLELLFKLYCTQEDREALAQKFDVSTKQTISFEEDIKQKQENLKNLSNEERKILLDLIKKLNSDG